MVDYDIVMSGPQRRPARFTSDAAFFIGFTLSRIDLSIRRRSDDLMSYFKGFETGMCHLKQTQNRAF